MKTLGILFIIAVASLAALAQQKSAPGFTEFKDSKFNYSLSRPADWEVLEPSNPKFRLKVRRVDGASAATFNISVTYHENFKVIPDKEFVAYMESNTAAIEAGFKRLHPTAKLLSSGRTKLAGREAFYAKSKAMESVLGVEREMLTHQVQMMRSGTAYTLTFTGETEAFNKYHSAFEGILASFVLQ